MTHLLRALLRRLTRIDVFFASMLRLTRLAEFCIRQRYTPRAEPSFSIEEFLGRFFADFTVRRGPFKGLRFPKNRITPSLAPKLIGSYEQEIASVVEMLCSTEWSTIIDIGSAEGYYAVGFALRVPRATIHAYDANPAVMQSCCETARLNGVENRIEVGSFLTPEALKDLALGERALIISDCEGYEFAMFSSEVVSKLRNHHVLVEVHDPTRGRLTSDLIGRFTCSHIVRVFGSVDDWKKPLLYDYPELEGLNQSTRMAVLAEARGDQMEWLYFSPRC